MGILGLFMLVSIIGTKRFICLGHNADGFDPIDDVGSPRGSAQTSYSPCNDRDSSRR